MSELEIDEELRDLKAPLSEDQINILTTSISFEGVRYPICVWGNKIIDGFHRYEIAKRLNINFEIKEYDFTDRNKCIIWIINNELITKRVRDVHTIRLVKMKSEIQNLGFNESVVGKLTTLLESINLEGNIVVLQRLVQTLVVFCLLNYCLKFYIGYTLPLFLEYLQISIFIIYIILMSLALHFWISKDEL